MGPMTAFLYARPSFLGGAARALDLGNTLTEFNRSLSAEQANKIALKMDWAMLGKAMRAAMVAYEAEHPAAGETQDVGEAGQAAA